MTRFRTAVKRLLVLASAGAACTVLGWTLAPSVTENAVANGDTRTIHFYHTHTGESIDATFDVWTERERPKTANQFVDIIPAEAI